MFIGLIAVLNALTGHLLSPVVRTTGGWIAMALIPIGTFLAVTQADNNQGLLICWILVFVPLFALIANGFGVGIFSEPTAAEWIVMGVRIGGSIALVLGTVAFVLGIGSRYAMERYQIRSNISN